MLLTLSFALVITAAGAAGGALSGMFLAARDLGHELAALMGAFYGLTVAVPTALLVTVYFALFAH